MSGNQTLWGRGAVVVGATSGIGHAVAHALAGLGALFLSERFNTKEAFALAAAAGAVTTALGICTAATNHNTRHPLLTAAGAVTLHRLTRGRYSLGLGRGFGALFPAPLHSPAPRPAPAE